jgi:hypothetical protein
MIQIILQLFHVLLELWPGEQAVLSGTLMPTVLATADLAMAILQHEDWFKGNSSSVSSQESSCDDNGDGLAERCMFTAAQAGYKIAELINRAAFCVECKEILMCSCGRVKQLPHSLRCSRSIRQLLLVSLCVVARTSRLSLRSRLAHVKASCGDEGCVVCKFLPVDSPYPQQLLEAPCYHQQLLSALNLSEQCLEWVCGICRVDQSACNSSRLAAGVTFGGQLGEGSAVDDAVSDEQQQVLDLKQLQCATYVPFLLTCVEIIALQAERPDVAYDVLVSVQITIPTHFDWLQQPSTPMQQQEVTQVLPAVLQHALPAVQYGEAVVLLVDPLVAGKLGRGTVMRTLGNVVLNLAGQCELS